MKTLLLSFLFPAFLFAYSINFNTALEKTIQNNKSLKAKQKEIDMAKLDLQGAKGLSYGELVFSENMMRTNHAGHAFGLKLASREASFADFGFDEFLALSGAGAAGSTILATQPEKLNFPDDRTNYETKVTYNLPIFTGFKLDSAKKMAQLQLLAKKALYGFDEKKLKLEIIKSYNGVVTAKEFIKAAKKAKEATTSFVYFAQELYKEGLVTNIDFKQAQVYDMGVDSKIVEATSRFKLALAYLRFLTNDSTISDVEDFQIISIESKPLKLLKEEALSGREDYKWMDLNTKTLKSKIDFESASLFPTVGAQLEYGFNNDTLNDFDNEHDYYMAVVGISYKIFDGNLSKSKAQKAKLKYKQAVDYFEYMRDGILLEVEKSYYTMKGKNKILLQKQKAQKLSSEVLEQSRQMYENQLINMSDLLTQQANEQKANAEAILAKYNAVLANATLKISLGKDIK